MRCYSPLSELQEQVDASETVGISSPRSCQAFLPIRHPPRLARGVPGTLPSTLSPLCSLPKEDGDGERQSSLEISELPSACGARSIQCVPENLLPIQSVNEEKKLLSVAGVSTSHAVSSFTHPSLFLSPSQQTYYTLSFLSLILSGFSFLFPCSAASCWTVWSHDKFLSVY